jgi:hypothetical protein
MAAVPACGSRSGLPFRRRSLSYAFGIESTFMKTPTRTWKRFAVGAGFVVLAFCAMCIWHKHDFCRGWSDHYASRAKQLRAEVANPILGPEERREHLIAADWHDIISHKYAVVAQQPWRPYPSYPLITPEEQRTTAAKH